MNLRADLFIFRRWLKGFELFDQARSLFDFPSREDRANGYLFAKDEQPWPIEFSEVGDSLLAKVQSRLETEFTIVLFQAYRNGSGCDWHTDDAFDAQAILSLGVTRIFGIRRSGLEPRFYSLNHGDLVFMPPGFQEEHEHCERVSLVFRTVKR
jgi:alkylated DNA repair dioxygenase AlkB